MHYLLKTEPSEYSFADLQRDQVTLWDGVTNPVALKNLRAMQPGDHLVIYHTGDERRTVGTASVVSVDLKDPHPLRPDTGTGESDKTERVRAQAATRNAVASAPHPAQCR